MPWKFVQQVFFFENFSEILELVIKTKSQNFLFIFIYFSNTVLLNQRFNIDQL